MMWQALPLAGLVAAFAVPLLIVLYFLKLRRSPRPVSSTLLWKKTIQDLRANAPFQRLRRNLLLFLQLIVLALIIAALARPSVMGERAVAERIVIMIDRSRSMNVTDPGENKTRLEAAKQAAVALVQALPEPNIFSSATGARQSSVMVIAFAEQADLVSNFTTDKKQLIERIRAIAPTDGTTNMGAALTLSRAYNRSVEAETRGQLIEDPPTIELYSDGNIRDLAAQKLEGETVSFHRMGSEQTVDNLAVVTLEASRQYERPTEMAVYATLANYLNEEVTTNVELALDGTPIQILAVTLPPLRISDETGELIPGTRGISFTISALMTGGTLDVRLLRPDVLPGDDRGVLVLPPPKRARVGYLTTSPLMPQALAGLPIEAERLSGDQVHELVRSGGTESYDVVILDGFAPEVPLTVGRFLTFGAPPIIDGLVDEGEDERGTIPISWDRRHPAMRNLELDDIPVDRFHVLAIADDMRVLMDGATGPLLVSVTRGDLQALVTAFRPIDSYWPLDPSYIVFLADAIRYLTDRGQSAALDPVKPGEAITLRLPARAREITLSLPGEGAARTFRVDDPTAISYGPVERTGLYRIDYQLDGQEGHRLAAANLFDRDESQVRAVSQLQMTGDRVDAASAGIARAQRPLWMLVLVAGLAVMLFEWWIYNRRVYL